MTLSSPSFFAASTSLSRPPKSAALVALAASLPEPLLEGGGEQAVNAANRIDAATRPRPREVEMRKDPPSWPVCCAARHRLEIHVRSWPGQGPSCSYRRRMVHGRTPSRDITSRRGGVKVLRGRVEQPRR